MLVLLNFFELVKLGKSAMCIVVRPYWGVKAILFLLDHAGCNDFALPGMVASSEPSKFIVQNMKGH